MRFRHHIAAALALACAIGPGGAHAATYTANSVIAGDTAYGMCASSSAAKCKADDRLNSKNALGETDGKFYALGLGGILTLGFENAVFRPGAFVTIEEVTFGGPKGSGHFEAVDVYSVFGNVATFVQTIYNSAVSTTFQVANRFEYIRLVDATLREYSKTRSADGFDVDSVKVTIAPVPIPAAGGFLLAGLGGLALMRRRKSAA